MKMVILLVTKMMNNTMTQGQWRIKGKIVKGEILEIGKWKVHKDTVDEYIHEINRGAGSFAIQSRLTQTQIEKRWERHLQRRYLVHEELLAMAYQYGNEKYYTKEIGQKARGFFDDFPTNEEGRNDLEKFAKALEKYVEKQINCNSVLPRRKVRLTVL